MPGRLCRGREGKKSIVRKGGGTSGGEGGKKPCKVCRIRRWPRADPSPLNRGRRSAQKENTRHKAFPREIFLARREKKTTEEKNYRLERSLSKKNLHREKKENKIEVNPERSSRQAGATFPTKERQRKVVREGKRGGGSTFAGKEKRNDSEGKKGKNEHRPETRSASNAKGGGGGPMGLRLQGK